jgi:hypothetical protein
MTRAIVIAFCTSFIVSGLLAYIRFRKSSRPTGPDFRNPGSVWWVTHDGGPTMGEILANLVNPGVFDAITVSELAKLTGIDPEVYRVTGLMVGIEIPEMLSKELACALESSRISRQHLAGFWEAPTSVVPHDPMQYLADLEAEEKRAGGEDE